MVSTLTDHFVKLKNVSEKLAKMEVGEMSTDEQTELYNKIKKGESTMKTITETKTAKTVPAKKNTPAKPSKPVTAIKTKQQLAVEKRLAEKAEKKANKYTFDMALIDGIKSLKKGGTKKEIFEAAGKLYTVKGHSKAKDSSTFKICDFVLPSLVRCTYLLKGENGVYTINPKFK